MLKLRYDKADGREGVIECAAIELDGGDIILVDALGRREPFLSYGGSAIYRDSTGERAKTAAAIQQQVSLEAAEGDVLAIAQPSDSGPLVLGAGRKLSLVADPDDMRLCDGRGPLLAVIRPRAQWVDCVKGQAEKDRSHGRHLTVAPLHYVENERAAYTAIEGGKRLRPSGLA